ncbi:beta-ketoacyl synthase [Pseudidiomarina sediminum]|uniref:Beta-ketoacyl synthase n=1 Tax=Pseudidiomarina sediminum TaxID=431675 RepID=A0A432Z299_9GAMM|nr:beta-ketoacyl synthase chain length factor [Pseudidiomarina sediminum]RUO72010.1 beta-ketoacyl synthase [Pseudidiomarina sediminum]
MLMFSKAAVMAQNDDAYAQDPLQSIPASTRRRLSPYAKLLMRGVLQLLEHHPQAAKIPVVLASQHGDLHRTIKLLHELAADQPLSPTQFSLSVNNAVLGQLSILLGNTAAMTTIAAGERTFAMGWLEASLQLQQAPEVLFIYTDEPPPEPYLEHAALPERSFTFVTLLSREEGCPVRFETHQAATANTSLISAAEHLQRSITQLQATQVELCRDNQRWQWHVGG